MSKGAKLSGTIHNLLVSRKVIEGKKISVLPKKKPIKPASTEASGKDEKPAEGTPAPATAEATVTPMPEAKPAETSTPEAEPAEASIA